MRHGFVKRLGPLQRVLCESLPKKPSGSFFLGLFILIGGPNHIDRSSYMVHVSSLLDGEITRVGRGGESVSLHIYFLCFII